MSTRKIKYRIVDAKNECLSFACTKREAKAELARVNEVLPCMNKGSPFYWPCKVPFKIVTEREWRSA